MTEALLEKPQQAITALQGRYPDAGTIKLHPADVPFFVQLCKTLGKPVNFVPVIDKDVRRWWRSDSLWQAHDARYDADQVCIIPGTQAVAGITRVDEPVGELLDRFEQASIDDVLARAPSPSPWSPAARRAPTSPARWPSCSMRPTCCGRAAPPSTRCTASVSPAKWQVNQNRSATHPSTGARLELSGDDARHAERSAVRHLDQDPVHAAVLHGRRRACRWSPSRTRRTRCVRCWRSPRAPTAPRVCPRCMTTPPTVTVNWDPEKVADHTGVTATFGAPLAPGLTLVPDALVGLCWPAVFSAIGSAVTDEGFPVVEGLLSLVHLDHAAHLLAPMPKAQPN